MAQNPAFPALDGAEYMSLVTFRENGDAVPTPVWFARAGQNLYVRTGATSGKVARLRSHPTVRVAPCLRMGEITGPAALGRARIVPEDDPAFAQGEAALDAKYGELRRENSRQLAERGIDLVMIEVAPVANA